MIGRRKCGGNVEIVTTSLAVQNVFPFPVLLAAIFDFLVVQQRRDGRNVGGGSC